MCHQATCSTCTKTTWWGCGNHVPSVMDNIPQEQWCTCEPKVELNGHEYPPKGSPASGVTSGLSGITKWFKS